MLLNNESQPFIVLIIKILYLEIFHHLRIDILVAFEITSCIINRPGIAGAVLQTALSLINSEMVCENIFTGPPRPNGWTLS